MTTYASVLITCSLALGMGLATHAVRADDIDGRVQSIDTSSRSIVIDSKAIHVDDKTRYEDGIAGFESIRQGDKVEVDYVREGDRLVATEIERDD